MPNLRLQLLPLLVSALFTLAGCKTYTQARIVGLSNKSDVPSNVIIPVQFKGPQEITKKALEAKGVFTLETGDCAEETSQETETAETDEAGETEEKKQEVAPKEKPESVPFFVHVVEAPKTTDEKGEAVFDIRAYLIPYSESSDEPPLLPGGQYCVKVASVPYKRSNPKEKEAQFGQATDETSAAFEVDGRDEFQFNTSGFSIVSWVPGKGKVIRPDDRFLVELSDAVNPSELKQGTYLCKRTATISGSAKADCNEDESRRDVEVYLAEDLVRNDGTTYRTSQFNLYGIKPSAPLEEGEEYVLKVGAKISETDRNSAQTIGFRLALTQTATTSSSTSSGTQTQNVTAKAATMGTASKSGDDEKLAWRKALEDLDQQSETKKKVLSTEWFPIKSSSW